MSPGVQEPQPLIEDLAKQVEALSSDSRDFFSLAFFMGGLICIVSGHALAENTGWIGWLAALVLFEPVGVLAIAAAAFVNSPRSRAARWLGHAYSRARPGLTALTLLMTFGLLVGLAWFVLQL